MGSALKQGRYWAAEVPVANTSGNPWTGSVSAYAAKAGQGGGGADLVATDSRDVRIPKATQAFSVSVVSGASVEWHGI